MAKPREPSGPERIVLVLVVVLLLLWLDWRALVCGDARQCCAARRALPLGKFASSRLLSYLAI